MQLKRTLNILGFEFSVVEKPTMEDCGEAQICRRLIYLDSSLPEATRIETLYHEVVHAMLTLGGYDELLGDKEEALVQFMGAAITQFLSNNPDLDVLHPAEPSRKEA